MDTRCLFILLVTTLVGFEQAHGVCDNSYNATTGKIQAPTNVSIGEKCRLTIKRGSGKGIKSFTQLLLSGLKLPGDSYLEIYDGSDDTSSNLLANFTGNSVLAVAFDHTTTIMYHVMSTDSSSWSFPYDTTGCNLNLVNPWAMKAQSPTYLPSRGDFTCTYKVTSVVPESLLAYARFSSVSLGSGSSFIIESGKNKVNQSGGLISLGDFFADGSEPITITMDAANSTVVQTFATVVSPINAECSGSEDVSKGYQMAITVPAGVASSCRKVLTVDEGTILAKFSSPVPDQGSFLLNFVNGDCSDNAILDSLTAGSAGTGYLVAGSSKSLLLTVQGKGAFNISFAKQEYGGRFSGEATLQAGTATKHNDSDPANTTSVFYQLTAAPGKQVSVQVLTKLRGQSTLTFYNGLQTSDPTIITSSAASQALTTIVGGNQVLVALENFPTNDNFTALFTSVDPGCNSLRSSSRGSFSFLGSSRTVNQTEICTWTVTPTVSAGTIVVNFLGLNLGKGESVSIYSGQLTSAPVVKYEGEMVASPLPQVYLPAGIVARIEVQVGATLRPSTNVAVSYAVASNACGGVLSAKTGQISTPNFPNQYPINADCVWTMGPMAGEKATIQNFLFVDFTSLSLAKFHTVSVVDGTNVTDPQILASYGGSKLPNSLLVPSNANTTIKFQSLVKSSLGVDAGANYQVGGGASLNYWLLDCGSNTSASNGTIQTPGYPKPVAAGVRCVWIVQVPQDSSEDNCTNIIQFNITTKGSAAKSVNKYVKVYNGPSMRSPAMSPKDLTPAKGILSNHSSIIVYLDTTASADKPVDLALSVAFSTYSCNVSELCDNGMCMHPGWRCNGVNDCGDFSDEKDCAPAPKPQPTPKPAPSEGTSGLVKSVYVAITFFIGLLIGILLVVFVPKVIRSFRQRGGNYNRMDDDHNIVA